MLLTIGLFLAAGFLLMVNGGVMAARGSPVRWLTRAAILLLLLAVLAAAAAIATAV